MGGVEGISYQIILLIQPNNLIWKSFNIKCPKQQTTMFSPSYDSLTFKSTKNLDIYNTRTLTQVILRHCGHKNQCVLLNNHACTNQFDLINLQINNLSLTEVLIQNTKWNDGVWFSVTTVKSTVPSACVIQWNNYFSNFLLIRATRIYFKTNCFIEINYIAPLSEQLIWYWNDTISSITYRHHLHFQISI